MPLHYLDSLHQHLPVVDLCFVSQHSSRCYDYSAISIMALVNDYIRNFLWDAKKTHRKTQKLLVAHYKAINSMDALILPLTTLEPVTIDVGGRVFRTAKQTLTKQSVFFQVFFACNFMIELTEDQEGYFLDADGEAFTYILEFLRTDTLTAPKRMICRLIRLREFLMIDNLKIDASMIE